MFLLDGEWHEIAEFWPYLQKQLDPVLAMRAYERCYKENGQPVPLEEKIHKGTMKKLKENVNTMRRDGIVEIEKGDVPSDDPLKWWLKLTDEYLALTRTESHAMKGKASLISGKIFNALRAAYAQGAIKIDVKIAPVKIQFVPAGETCDISEGPLT